MFHSSSFSNVSVGIFELSLRKTLEKNQGLCKVENHVTKSNRMCRLCGGRVPRPSGGHVDCVRERRGEPQRMATKEGVTDL